MQLRNVVIVDGVRSPFARGGRGKLVATRLDDVGATVIRTLLERNPKVKPSMIEDVGLGNVAQSGEFIGLGHVARLAGLPMEVSAFNVNRQCGSSMETLQRIVSGIAVGALDCGISLGIERMGRTLGGGGGPRPNMTRVNQPKRLELNKEQRDMSPDHGKYFSVPFPDYILDATPMQSMLQTAQNVAEIYNISRAELDEFTVRSHKKYGEAFQKGNYKDEIIPLEVEEPVYDDEGNWVPDSKGKMITFDIDEGYRPGTNFEALQNLKPVQGYVSFGNKELVITAGNSCPTNDGVSAAILMSEDKAKELGLEPLARIVGMGVAGVKPQLMGIGPIPSTHKAARNAGITMDQIDRVEFNEAFAAQVIPTLRDLGITEDKVNVNGGSLAIGHPMGATGARLVTTVSKELRRSGKKYGLATQCIGAGMGISTIVEALY
jgi:3-oxo-5,6-didehydrosuberyl-CoA/3-oxoadipyl-CoA thiolase